MRPLLFHLALTIALLANAQDVRYWGITADASPWIEYLGDLGSGTHASPVLQVDAFNGAQGLSILIGDSTQANWWNLAISTRLGQETERRFIELLDNDLNVIPNAIGEQIIQRRSTQVTLRISKERWTPTGRLRGQFAHGLRSSIFRDTWQKDALNPLESIIGDTLFADTGFTLAVAYELQVGVLYFVNESVFISGSFRWGPEFMVRPEGRLRQVEDTFDGTDIVQSPLEPGQLRLSVDNRAAATLRLGLLF